MRVCVSFWCFFFFFLLRVRIRWRSRPSVGFFFLCKYAFFFPRQSTFTYWLNYCHTHAHTHAYSRRTGHAHTWYTRAHTPDTMLTTSPEVSVLIQCDPFRHVYARNGIGNRRGFENPKDFWPAPPHDRRAWRVIHDHRFPVKNRNISHLFSYTTRCLNKINAEWRTDTSWSGITMVFECERIPWNRLIRATFTRTLYYVLLRSVNTVQSSHPVCIHYTLRFNNYLCFGKIIIKTDHLFIMRWIVHLFFNH